MFDHKKAKFCSDNLELLFASTRRDNDPQTTSPQEPIPPTQMDHTPVAVPLSNTDDTYSPDGSEPTPHTSHGGAIPFKTIALATQPSTNTHPQDTNVPSSTATREGKRHTSLKDVKHHLFDGPSATVKGSHQSSDYLSLAGRQYSSFVTDKALNITWATGVSERGPDSSNELTVNYCDRQNRLSNLGEPHRYGIALSDPYLKVVPPPPITVKPPD